MINDEKCYPLNELRTLLPIKPAYPRLWHWCRKGVKVRVPGSDKPVSVKMECVRLPSGLGSSVEAYHRFVEKLTEIQQIET